ncbi:MAG: hypothetical protein ACYTHM_22195 [Planctomycetota bacterium]|jgi:hypothetical protein
MKTNNNTEFMVLIFTALVVLGPLAYGIVAYAASPPPAGPFLEMPDAQIPKCIKDFSGEYMRLNHWDLLNQARDKVVREGVKGDMALNDCWKCHKSKERFCDRCHDLVSLRMKCFRCHSYPK